MILRSLDTKRLLVVILFISIFTMATQGIGDPDFFWHLRTGKLIWETWSIPRQDPFSYTVQGRSWIAHEWLTEALLFGLYSFLGQRGLILAFAFLITCTFILVYLQCEGKPWLATFVVLLAALTSAISWGVRPQMVSLFLSALFLYILNRKESCLWLLPPLMALWVNLHGGYLLGLALFCPYIIGQAATYLRERKGKDYDHLRQLSLVFLLCGVATLLNPHGWRILSYPFGTLGSEAMQAYIAEWFSPDFHQARFQPLALLILLVFATFALSKPPPDLTDMLLLLPFGYASLRSARNVPLFAVVVAPILSSHLASLWEGSWLQKRLSQKGQAGPNLRLCVLNWFLLLLILCAASFKAALSLKENESLQRQEFPVAAIDYLEGEERGNIYNLYRWGGYLIWRLYPKWQVFIDGRADVYGDAFIEEYLEVYQVRRGWGDILDKHKVDLVLIDRGSALATLLHEDRGWQEAYEDELAVLYRRYPKSD